MTKNLAEVLNPSSLDVVKLVINACSDANGHDIKVLDVAELFGIADYFVVVSARSDRQVLGITQRIIESLERAGIEPSSLEGLEEAHWVLADCGDVVVHVFYEPVRSHYDIEGLWAKAKKLEIRDSKKAGAALELRAA